MESLDSIRDEWLRQIAASASLDALEQIRVGALGRNGQVTGLLKGLGALQPEERKARGAAVNSLKNEIETALGAAKARLDQASLDRRLAEERIDVTLPVKAESEGRIHPISQTIDELIAIFGEMGFTVAEGPHIEDDFYNFTALNIPPEHPARQEQDTFYLNGTEGSRPESRKVLRTHTSPVQIRAMQQQAPPIRAIVPGKVHRADTADATHSPIFHQVEGLAVDTNITFSDLKGTLDHAMKAFFGSSVKTRFFPSFFPFTEPSADVSVTCFKCGGQGCRLCKMSGWIELLGCGMVDPNVFGFVKSNGYDPAKISGFAFGMGVERIAMLKYGIDDIQLFYQGDVRFLEQFA